MMSMAFDELNNYLNNREKCSKLPQKNILFLGPPGSGKGTQARLLSKYLCYCHLSSGDLIRKAINNLHSFGQKEKELMEKGQLVSNEFSIEVISPVVSSLNCSRGIIFDGFPRELDQLPYLDKMLNPLGKKIDVVFEFNTNKNELIERIEGRQIHLTSGRTYHSKFNPPKVEGLDDITGEPLIQRKDDNAETLKTRIDIYNKKTEPLVEYYRRKGILLQVNSTNNIKEIFNEIKSKILN